MQDQTGIAVITPPVLEIVAREICDDEVVERLLKYLRLNRPMLTEIKAAVCAFYRIEPVELAGPCREGEIVLPRQIFCYFAFKYTRFALARIGWEVGLRDHTTVRHAFHKIEKLASTNALLRDDIDLLRLRISEKILQRKAELAS